MEHEVRYCMTYDGVRIAYCVEGDGPPLLFMQAVHSFSLSHLVPTIDRALARFGLGRQLIRYDMRGTGLSQLEVDGFSPESDLLDMEAVLRAVAPERLAIIGVSLGGPRAIHYAARHPDQVDRLVLYETFSRVADAFAPGILQAFAQLTRTNWEVASHAVLSAGLRSQDEQVARRWAEMLRKSITGEAMARFIEGHADEDLTPLLGKIQCPTLVCHSVDDIYIPFALGRRMAELIPSARLVPFEGEAGGIFNHGPAIEAIDAFLPRQLPDAARGDQAAADAPAPGLTPRETEILRLVAAGRTSGEISRELSLSIRTVGRHITNIYNKIGARGRSDATSYAIWHGIARE